MGILDGVVKIVKEGSGLQAYRDRKEARETKEAADEELQKVCEETNRRRDALNASLQELGLLKLKTLRDTVGHFLSLFKDMGQRNVDRSYEILREVEIRSEEIKELENLEMTASQALKGTLAAGSAAAAGLTGVPSAVTAAITAFGTASTGTAISSLSGIAASNAVLAWLGGGAIAAGGGGIAAGTLVLTGITAGTTAVAAVLVAGFIASAYYSKILTEAEDYERRVREHVEKLKVAWIAMDGIQERVAEISRLTSRVASRANQELRYLVPLVPDFEPEDEFTAEVFQRTARDSGEPQSTPTVRTTRKRASPLIIEIFSWLTEEQSSSLNEKQFAAVKQEIGGILICPVNLVGKLELDPVACAEEKLQLNEKTI